VHCTGAHPCPSRSALVPLNLSAARSAVRPHMLSSPVPARILPACRGDLGPCARQLPTFGPTIVRTNPRAVAISSCVLSNPPARRAAASAGRATTSPRVPRVRCSQTARPPRSHARHQLASRDAHRSSPEHRRPRVPESAAARPPAWCHQRVAAPPPLE
jgi:hypothetical protein